MATTTGNTNRVVIFDPVIKWTAGAGGTTLTDVGFIGDTVSFQYTQNIQEYNSGIPKSLRKSLKTEESAVVRFDLMESTIGNFQSALNRQTADLAASTGTTLFCGGDSTVNVLTNFTVSGQDDQGKDIEILFYKAIIKETGEFNIDDNFFKIPVTVMAVADLTRDRGKQLFEIGRAA